MELSKGLKSSREVFLFRTKRMLSVQMQRQQLVKVMYFPFRFGTSKDCHLYLPLFRVAVDFNTSCQNDVARRTNPSSSHAFLQDMYICSTALLHHFSIIHFH